MMREIRSMIFTLMNAVFLIRGLAGESLSAEAGLDVVRREVDRAGITSRSDVAHWDVARDYPGRELIWQTASLRVTKWERDLPVPDGNFGVSLPPGTIVLEESTRRRYLTGEQGDRRILSDAELRRMGLAVARGRVHGWRSVWIVPSVIAGVVLAGAVLNRKWIPGLRRVTTNDCDSAGSAASDEAI